MYVCMYVAVRNVMEMQTRLVKQLFPFLIPLYRVIGGNGINQEINRYLMQIQGFKNDALIAQSYRKT